MAMITLHNTSLPEVTILSNTFIDNYMPEANGEFVKVYIYLLRAPSSARSAGIRSTPATRSRPASPGAISQP